MGKKHWGAVPRRAVALGLGILLTGSAFTGIALADETTPNDPIGSVVDGVTGGGSSASDESDSDTSTDTTPGTDLSSPGSAVDLAEPPAGSDVSPKALLPGVTLPTAFPSFPSAPNIPTIPAGTDPVAACSTIASSLFDLDPTQLSAALRTPAAIFCGTLVNLPTLPGGTPATSGDDTYTVFPEPEFYGGYGHRHYGRYFDDNCGCDRYASANYQPQTDVATTQVSGTAPKGGVSTGDGSYP